MSPKGVSWRWVGPDRSVVARRGGCWACGFRVESGDSPPAGPCLLSGMGVRQAPRGQVESAELEAQATARGSGTRGLRALACAWVTLWSRRSGPGGFVGGHKEEQGAGNVWGSEWFNKRAVGCVGPGGQSQEPPVLREWRSPSASQARPLPHRCLSHGAAVIVNTSAFHCFILNGPKSACSVQGFPCWTHEVPHLWGAALPRSPSDTLPCAKAPLGPLQ